MNSHLFPWERLHIFQRSPSFWSYRPLVGAIATTLIGRKQLCSTISGSLSRYYCRLLRHLSNSIHSSTKVSYFSGKTTQCDKRISLPNLNHRLISLFSWRYPLEGIPNSTRRVLGVVRRREKKIKNNASGWKNNCRQYLASERRNLFFFLFPNCFCT